MLCQIKCKKFKKIGCKCRWHLTYRHLNHGWSERNKSNLSDLSPSLSDLHEWWRSYNFRTINKTTLDENLTFQEIKYTLEVFVAKKKSMEFYTTLK